MSNPELDRHKTATAVQIRRAYEDHIAATMRYCAAHCDSEKESEVVAWVAEKLAEGRPLRVGDPLDYATGQGRR